LFLLLSGDDWPIYYSHLDSLQWLGGTLSAGRSRLVLPVRTPLFCPGDWPVALDLLGSWRDQYAPAWRLGSTLNLEVALGFTPEPLDDDVRERLASFQVQSMGGMLQRLGRPRATRALRLTDAPAGPFPFRIPLSAVARRIENELDAYGDPQYVVEDVAGLLRLLPLAAGRPKLHGSLRRMAVMSREWLQLRKQKPKVLADVPLLLVPGL